MLHGAKQGCLYILIVNVRATCLSIPVSALAGVVKVCSAQEIYEGCLTKLEGHGLVQLVLGSTAGLLDADLVCESDLCKLLHLVRAYSLQAIFCGLYPASQGMHVTGCPATDTMHMTARVWVSKCPQSLCAAWYRDFA